LTAIMGCDRMCPRLFGGLKEDFLSPSGRGEAGNNTCVMVRTPGSGLWAKAGMRVLRVAGDGWS